MEIAAMGVEALGFNFWPQSKRYLPLMKAGWLASLKPLCTVVAVMVNPSDRELGAVLDSGLVHCIQLHGDESPKQVADLLSAGVSVIKGLPVRDEASLARIADFPCENLLLDAYCPGAYGGGGKAFPWALASLARERFPDKRLILSGGLSVGNVRDAIEQTNPAAVDVASGVESAPGIKEIGLVREFIEQVRLVEG